MNFFRKDYDENYYNTFLSLFSKFINKRRVSLVLKYKNSGNLLDIGCGTGDILSELSKYFSIEGIDISSSAIKIASKKIDKKKLKKIDIESYFLNKKYDIIIAFDVFEHLNNPKKIIKKIYTHLTQNGILIFIVPNNYGILGLIFTKIFNFMDKTHISTYKRKFWIEFVRNSGFYDFEILNESIIGFLRNDISKYFTHNLTIICKK